MCQTVFLEKLVNILVQQMMLLTVMAYISGIRATLYQFEVPNLMRQKKNSGHCCTLSVNTRNVIRLHQCAEVDVIIVSIVSVNRLKERFELAMFDESLLKVSTIPKRVASHTLVHGCPLLAPLRTAY